MIAICCATRGMIFTEVDIAIDQIKEHFDSKIFRTFNKPIPEAQNFLVEEALKTNAEYLLYIEEDVVPTLSQVREMVNRNVDIVFIDYGVNGWSCSAKDKSGKILWAGIGCTLVKRKVFEKIDAPWFRTDKSLRLNDWKWIDNPSKYGGQDIWFFRQAIEAGCQVVQIAGEVRHIGLKVLGKKEVNNGLHEVFVKEKIKNYQIIEREVK